MDREKKIIKVSIMGIVVNIILVIFKAIVGLLANSIAIILDAINNLSDALSSIITIIGTKLSNKKPNKKHPYGYGRIEYFSSVIIAILVFTAGITSLKESFEKIVSPVKADYTIFSIIIIVVAVFVKFFFGKYVKKQGETLHSGSLVASGTDAIGDSILSSSTILCAIISLVFKLNLEGYVGFIISLMIIKSAFEIFKETIDEIIGVRIDSSITDSLKHKINAYEGVLGVFDITIHNYGPNKLIGTAHIQVADDLTAKDIHKLTRQMTYDIYYKDGIIMTFGIYATNDTGFSGEVKNYILPIIRKYKSIIQIHGFFIDEEVKMISFDLIFNFEEKNINGIIEEIKNEIKQKYPEYEVKIIIDVDFSD